MSETNRMTALDSLVSRVWHTACRRGEFHLPTGQVLDEYFDEYVLASDPVLLRDVAAEMALRVPTSAEAVVGLELGGIPLTVALSAVTGLPAGFLRRNRKSYGTRRQLEGCAVEGKRVVLVDDVVRSGSQLVRAASILRRVGASVEDAVCVLDRCLDGRVRLAEHQVDLRCLFSADVLDATSFDRRL